MTPEYAKAKLHKLRALGFSFNTLLIDDASFMTSLDTMFAMYSCNYSEGNQLDRVVMSADKAHSLFMADSLYQHMMM
jgi:hypothetical protein